MIDKEKEGIKNWEKDKRALAGMHKKGKPLEEIYEWEDNWEWLHDKYDHLLPVRGEGEGFMQPEELRQFLNNNVNWPDDYIWKELIEVCDDRIKYHKDKIGILKKEKVNNKLKLQVINRLGNIPSRMELDRLLRYEGAIERQFYKALNQLERQQRLRRGDNVPAPVEIDLDVNTG